jgi:hypothetical protein
MQVGDNVWIFDSNRRVYKDDKGNETNRAWYRGHFREQFIIGETTQSWIVGDQWQSPYDRYIIKVNKKTLTYKYEYGRDGHLYTSEEEVNRKCWIEENKHRIHNDVNYCNDYDKLMKIDAILKSD